MTKAATTVQTLREAAQLMRSYAEAATPSPWASGLMGVWSEADEGGYIATDLHLHNPCRSTQIAPGNRMHIAAWHPAVALAVADWLEDHAAWLDEGLGTCSNLHRTNYPDAWTNTSVQALAVARAYLGGAA